MERPVWIFVRGSERLEISREVVDDGVTLIVAGDGTPRSYFFRDKARVDVFQHDMETLLLKTGWTFTAFEPEKRTGRDRRGWPRKSDDRRRWWTDGTNSARQPRAKSRSASSAPQNADAKAASKRDVPVEGTGTDTPPRQK